MHLFIFYKNRKEEIVMKKWWEKKHCVIWIGGVFLSIAIMYAIKHKKGTIY